MYGWIVDGISSLFEAPEEKLLTECPNKERGREGSVRAAKRSYHSIDINESVNKSEVEVKRRRRDVVVSFVKKTISGMASFLRLRQPLMNGQQDQLQNEDTQLVIPMGIDELNTSCFTKYDWIMDKSSGAKNPFKTSSPPLMRKHSGDRRGSLQLLPSRPALRLDPVMSSGHSRCYKPSLTVEETIRLNDRERYRRLLEMVSANNSKNQPLPFNQAKPQDELSSKTEPAAVHKPLILNKTKPAVSSGVFSWRNQTPKNRWCAASFTLPFAKPVDDAQHSIKSNKTTTMVTKPRPTAAEDVDLSTEVATRLHLVDKTPTASSSTPAVNPSPEPFTHSSSHLRLTEEELPRLSKEMAAEVSAALSQRDPSLVLSSAFKLRITQRDLATLQEGGWLNDEVINFYLSLMMDRSSAGGGLPRVYAFSTFFFPKLQGLGVGQSGGHAAVRRWTKAVDLFLCDLVLVPLHLGVHWAMAIIDLRSKTVKSYDSMGQRHDDICKMLLLYLKEEHKVKKGRELDVSKWSVSSLRSSEIPQQKNGSDCGVFACKYADYISRDRPLTFKQCHMPLFRKLMIWEVVHQKLL